MTTDESPAQAWRAAASAVLEQYPFEVVRLERIPQGLINLSVKLTTAQGEHLVLQRVNRVFAPTVNDNLHAVASHLLARGILSPALQPTRSGARAVTTAAGDTWRVLNWMPGRALDGLENVQQARSAGALLARFHGALLDFDAELAGQRRPVHDFPRHRSRLADVLAMQCEHRLYAVASALADQLEQAIAALPAFDPGAVRVVHGDPKISNVMFETTGDTALCLIDLDTLARMPLYYELGDALRSWCNRHGEDSSAAHFELAIFEAAVGGYCDTACPALLDGKFESVVCATVQIHLELACRFLADALEECYFAWDETRFASHGEHNLARVRGQLRAAADLSANLAVAEAIAAAAARRGKA